MAEVGTQAGQWVVVNPVYTATRIEQLKALHDAFAFWHTGTEVDANGVPKTVSGIHFYNDGSGHIFTGFMSGNDYERVLRFDNDTPIEIYWDDLATYIANYCGLPIEPVPQPSEAYTRTLRNEGIELFANNSDLVRQMLAEFRAVSISTTARIPEAQVQELVEEIYERFTKTSDTFSEAVTHVLSRAVIKVEL